MPYRTFVDSSGTDWQVWDIVPRLSERRGPDLADRRVKAAAIAFANRRRDSRRIVEHGRTTLRGAYAQGWLCFESDKEKRRLSPIPGDWTSCSDEQLEAYVRRGERVTRSRNHTLDDFSGEPPLADAG